MLLFLQSWLRTWISKLLNSPLLNKTVNTGVYNLGTTRLDNESLSKHLIGIFYIVSTWLYATVLQLWVYRSQFLTFAIITLLFDALGSDEEPLWEPIEWSMVQIWILFIFIFGWFAEGLILSRYGGYTGRDKRVWYSLYKTYWLLEIYYILSLGAAIVCVITPFYYELNYEIAHIFSWWHWYSRVFFAYTMFIFALISVLLNLLQLNVRWLFWKKILLIVFCINILLTYLLYTHFLLACFSYFTDPVWFHRNRTVDFIQLSHEPLKWGWGTGKRDHFTYHNTKTSFWFKSDGPYASAMILIHFFVFGSLFLLYIFWLVLFRRIYATAEVPLSFTTYCISALRQFFYLFYLFYFLVGFSFLVVYLRSPFEDYNLSELKLDSFFFVEYLLYWCDFYCEILIRWSELQVDVIVATIDTIYVVWHNTYGTSEPYWFGDWCSLSLDFVSADDASDHLVLSFNVPRFIYSCV